MKPEEEEARQIKTWEKCIIFLGYLLRCSSAGRGVAGERLWLWLCRPVKPVAADTACCKICLRGAGEVLRTTVANLAKCGV